MTEDRIETYLEEQQAQRTGAAIVAAVLVSVSTGVLISPWTIPGVVGVAIWAAYK